MSITLAQTLESLKNEITVNENGIGYVSIRGAARLAGVAVNSLNVAFSTGQEKPSKLAQFLIQYGFSADQQKRFASEKIPDKALGLILNYYSMKAGQYCTEEAQLAVLTFTTIGVRSWLHKSVGYVDPNQKRSKAKQLKPVLTDEEKLEKVHADLLKYCKGEPRTTGYFGSGHSFVRRLDVLALFGKKGQKYLNKPQIIRLFRSAEAAGLGCLNVNGKQIYTFTPFNSQPLLTA